MTDVYDLIEQQYPFDGPHSGDTVTDAAAALSELVRYLANATGPSNSRDTLRYAARTDRVLGSLIGATYGLDQLLRQLGDALDAQAANPTLYDDRRDRPGRDTALRAVKELHAGADLAARLTAELENARSRTYHLGNDETPGRR